MLLNYGENTNSTWKEVRIEQETLLCKVCINNAKHLPGHLAVSQYLQKDCNLTKAISQYCLDLFLLKPPPGYTWKLISDCS